MTATVKPLHFGMGTLRLILAISVVLSHVGSKYTITEGDVAVEAFFVISGFLMCLVLTTKYDPLKDKKTFWLNRSFRIFPLYYIVVIFSVLLSLVLARGRMGYFVILTDNQSQLTTSNWAYLAISLITVVGQEWLLFMHQTGQGLRFWVGGIDPLAWQLALLPQAWSLSLELMFYVLVPFLVRLRTSRLVLLIVAGSLLKVFIHFRGLGDPWTNRLFPAELPLFLLGMLAYRHRQELRSSAKRAAFWAIPSSFFVHPARYVLIKLGLPEDIATVSYLLLVALSLPVLFERNSPLDTWMGELSYPLYLIHYVIVVTLQAWWTHAGIVSTILKAPVAILASLLAAKMLVAYIEVPIDKWRHRRTHVHVAPFTEAT